MLEARTIAREKPWFNRRLKDAGRHVWVRVDLRDPFPRLEVTRQLAPGPWRYVGPLPAGARAPARARRARRRARAAHLSRRARSRPRRAGVPAARSRAVQRAVCRADGARRLRTSRGARAGGARGRATSDAARAAGARARRPAAPLPRAVASALAALRAARRASHVVVVVPAAHGAGHRLIAVVGGRLRLAVSARVPDLRRRSPRVAAALTVPADAIVPREALDEIRVVTAWLASPIGTAPRRSTSGVSVTRRPGGACRRLPRRGRCLRRPQEPRGVRRSAAIASASAVRRSRRLPSGGRSLR